jgi:hypothetical protein
MSAFHAKQQFEDNRLHFADTPEKQNLYNGLTNIAIELNRSAWPSIAWSSG